MIKHFYIVTFLLLYQMLCGYFLYKVVHSIIVPTLFRLPHSNETHISRLLFWVENYIGFLQDKQTQGYVWILCGLILLKMLVSPFIQAGVLHCLHCTEQKPGPVLFLRGMRNKWICLCLVQLFRLALLILPVYWMIPRLYLLLTYMQNQFFYIALYVLTWLIYSCVVHYILLYAQFGIVYKYSIFSSVYICFKFAIRVTALIFILGSVHFLLFCSFYGVSLVWGGVFGLITHQCYHLIRLVMQVWKVCSHFTLYQTKMIN